MGKVLSGYKSAVINDITNGGTNYYAFAANPISYPSTTPAVTSDDYSAMFTHNWQMLFGKLVQPNDIKPVIKNIEWKENTVYERYDNTKELAGNFYVITKILTPGGGYHIFKCIDNNNGAPSTVKPTIQEDNTTFETTADKYKWRFITSISEANYIKFATSSYAPIYPNTSVADMAFENSGIDVVPVVSSGTGYHSYHSGIIQGIDPLNPRILQIGETAKNENNFYTGNAIYLHNDTDNTNQIATIIQYEAKVNGTRWVTVDSDLDLESIDIGETTYIISPKVIFKTNGLTQPIAYTVMNTVANNIASIRVVETGSYISWANVSIQSNSIFGSGANAYAIVPPPGGHGANPAEELNVKGFCVSTTFANTDGLPNNVLYNKIGLIANPYEIDPSNGDKTAIPFTSSVFNALTDITPKNSQVYTVGEIVRETTTNSYGTVAFSNTTTLLLTGDKTFVDNNSIVSANGQTTSQITLNTLGDIYTKDIRPIYVQNIANVQRANTQSEFYKLIIQI